MPRKKTTGTESTENKNGRPADLGDEAPTAQSSSVLRPTKAPAHSVQAEAPQLNWIANHNWGIANDVLRDLYVRGKHRDVILPMTDDAPPVIRKIHTKGTTADPLRGLAATIDGRPAVVEYEPDPDLRDTEQVPLLGEGGIEAFLRREVLPHAKDTLCVPDNVKPGYEVSFTRYFYKSPPVPTLKEIRADILALENKTEGLLGEIIRGGRA